MVTPVPAGRHGQVIEIPIEAVELRARIERLSEGEAHYMPLARTIKGMIEDGEALTVPTINMVWGQSKKEDKLLSLAEFNQMDDDLLGFYQQIQAGVDEEKLAITELARLDRLIKNGPNYGYTYEDKAWLYELMDRTQGE
jgi:hypothetical protein